MVAGDWILVFVMLHLALPIHLCIWLGIRQERRRISALAIRLAGNTLPVTRKLW